MGQEQGVERPGLVTAPAEQLWWFEAPHLLFQHPTVRLKQAMKCGPTKSQPTTSPPSSALGDSPSWTESPEHEDSSSHLLVLQMLTFLKSI